MGTVGSDASSLSDLLYRVADTDPGRTALVEGSRSVTYGELRSAADGIAARLYSAGVRRGDRVGVLVDSTFDAVVATLGVLRVRAAYVPLDCGYPAERLRYMATDADLRCVVGRAAAAIDAGLGEFTVVDLDGAGGDHGRGDHGREEPGREEPGREEPGREDPGREEPGREEPGREEPGREEPGREEPGPPPPDLPAAGDPAYVIYTSGSTGAPKGCVVSHRNVLAMLRNTVPLFDVDARDRWTVFHSLSFDFAVWELWGALCTGATAVCTPALVARSPDDFLDFLVRERITVLNQVPSAFRALVKTYSAQPARALSLRYVIFGGESVDLADVRAFAGRFSGRGPTMVNMYGITEITVHGTIKLLDEEACAGPVRSPIGVALPHLRIDLLDDERRAVPTGTVGEMWISGDGVAQGYLNRPELTAERFVMLDTADGPRRCYRSGDLARRLPDGDLEYVGRNDQQIKLRGYRIEPAEIEQVLRRHPLVHDVAVVATPRPSTGVHLAALVVPAAGQWPASAEATLRKHAAAALPRHLVPARYLAVPELPVMPSGKLDRRGLVELAAGAWRSRL